MSYLPLEPETFPCLRCGADVPVGKLVRAGSVDRCPYCDGVVRP